MTRRGLSVWFISGSQTVKYDQRGRPAKRWSDFKLACFEWQLRILAGHTYSNLVPCTTTVPYPWYMKLPAVL